MGTATLTEPATTASTAPETFVRPNGKTYRPRKGLRQIGFYNESKWTDHVVVLGTHDVERARAFGSGYRSPHLVNGTPIWGRWTIRDGEQWWDFDDVRGAPGVLFTESDDPEETAPRG